jgi:hypothetical protein
MNEWEVISIELMPPVAGRGLLRASRGPQSLEFPFSYSPRDSVECLAEAVDGMMIEPGERRVTFSAGPEELEILFDRDIDRVDVRFVVYPGHRRHRDQPGEERMAFTGNTRLVGKLFWRALRQFQSRIDTAQYQEAWHHPFPERLVAQLGSRFSE